MILITGATGNLGSTVVDNLLKHMAAEQLIALVRDESKAGELKQKGVQIRTGNFDEPATLQSAMKDVNKVLLISTADPQRFQQHKNVVDAAKAAGVDHLVYTSVSMDDVENAALVDLMASHFQTEDYIKQSGIAFTFLRNSLYAEVIPMFVGEKVFETGIFLPAGTGKVPFALRREMGEAAAIVLSGEEHLNKIYEITGAELYSFNDVAELLTEISGHTVGYVDAEEDTYSAQLKQFGLPEAIMYLLTGFSADIKANRFQKLSSDLELLLGRKPASLKESLKEIYSL